eukprot:GILJ01000100.1.p1 GENE.GILJ01000100.1~~GILJ01000100.1.p1  ORF type:complete len:623 (-),score=111.24 GILJ01000100.1:212-2080(-)
MAVPHSSASLYCGDLNPEVTEAMLFEIFNSVGPVASIRVCRDAVTRRSLGYAYINFHNPLDAERALDALNFTTIRGRPVRIMWSHRDPGLRKSGAGNIFVKNLDKTLDNKALYDTFSIFGNILSCKVATDENAQSRGFGFVHYESEESAMNACAKVNGMLIGTKKVFVGPFVRKSERQENADEIKFTNIYVKNLPTAWDEEKMKEVFGAAGPISSAVLMRGEDNSSKEFGFINFENPEAAKKAVDDFNEKDFDGKKVFVGRAQKKAEREAELRHKFEQKKLEIQQKYQGVNLYVKNLDDQVDDDKLREEFSKFGTITSCKVMKDEKNASRGFGFVCFSAADEATKAVTDMNGKLVFGKPLYVALAQRKDARRAQLEAQYAQQARLNPAAAGMRMQPGLPAQPQMYPGQPMFYPGMGPQARPGFVYPQQMMARPAWRPQQAQPRPTGYPTNVPFAMPVPQRGQRQNRGPRPQGQPVENGRPAGQVQPGQPQNANQKRFRYTANARNRADGAPMSAPMQNAPMPQENAITVQGQEPLTASALASAPPEQQKQMLGERLFPLIHNLQPELAGKITGMLLEMDNSELLMLLESQESLHSKVDEALAVLAAHGQLHSDEGAADADQQ